MADEQAAGTSTPMMHNKLLIIEDDKALSDLLADKFRAEGFDVTTASDGETGLKLALEWKPDLVLLDIVMPRMDGMTMLHKLREDDQGKKIQVVLLTNLSDTEKVYDAMSNGVFDYLVKSNWEIDDLVKEVRAKLSPPR
jgi:two-component system, OmpR family, response regulator RpaA